MLSSSPSLLLPGLTPFPVMGEAVAPVAVKAASGFADLLGGLATKAVEAISGEASGEQESAEQPAVGGTAPLAKDETAATRAGRRAADAKPRTAEGKATAAVQPAAAALAAIESGKILPVALPDAAAADGALETEASVIEAIATPSALPLVAGALPVAAGVPPAAPDAPAVLPAMPSAPPVQTAGAEPAVVATPSRRTATVAARTLAHKVNAGPSQPVDKATPEPRVAEARPIPAVTITVGATVQAPVGETAEAIAKPVAPARAKPTHAADLVRVELPQVATPALAATPFAAADHSTQPVSAGAPVPSAPAAMPSPNDIDAALDQLVAAREALMPAEASLAIEHAEFGEVSIRFEQSSDGQLSAELTAADPELQRAVTAAIATDRGAAPSTEGDNRSAQLANQRGSAATGGDVTGGGRGQSNGQSGAEREPPQRRDAAASQGRRPATDQRPGIFA